MLARAKVNLCLHVTGQRNDGMHLLDSIVVFPEVGDVITARPADSLSLEITGPFAQGLRVEPDNLILQAARLLSNKGAALTLEKNLPLASGIGGGSSDAATSLRLLSEIWNAPIPRLSTLTNLGADVPVCMHQVPTRMQGIGDVLSPLPSLPSYWVVLVNSGNAVETGAVFRKMKTKQNPPIMNIPDTFSDTSAFFDFLKTQRNDMQEVAQEISPSISKILMSLESTESCALPRMSGSGGTCFGLYHTEVAARAAAASIRQNNPTWWVVAAKG